MKRFFKYSLFSLYAFGAILPVRGEDGVTPTTITFGQSAAFKGSSSALGSELWRGADAYFQHVNKTGGVNGRRILIEAINDGYEGDQTLFNTIRLVQQNKVFALFGYVGTPTIVKALPAIQKFSSQGVVLFSNFTGAQPQREFPHKKYVFNVRSSYRDETAGIVRNLVKIGHKKIGVFIQFDAYGRSGADGVARALKEFNLKIASEVTYKRGAKFPESMKAQVDKLKADGVTAVVSIGSYAACAAFIRDARMGNFNGPIANVSFVGADSLLKLLMKEGASKSVSLTQKLINTQVVPPWDDTNYPVVQEYQELMDKYRPKVPSQLRDPNFKAAKYSFVSLEGFINAKALVEILKRSPKNLTRKNFVKAIKNSKGVDLGLGHILNFSKKRHQALDVVFFTTIKNGKYVIIRNWGQFR